MCDCIYHRYHVVHVCGCGALISHSQGDWNEHRLHEGEMVTLDSAKYQNGDTAETVVEKADSVRGWALAEAACLQGVGDKK